MLYILKVVATMIVSFAAGIVLHRVLWKFFDKVLDALEHMDDEDRL
jgi:flagellar biosynthesis protein FliQ